MARQLFTAKSGGVSTGSYSSLNVAEHVGDVALSVVENRKRLKRLLSLDSIVFMNQVHGNEVVVIDKQLDNPPNADALVTTTKGIGLTVMVADCLPILIDGGSVIAAVHVGRRGMVNGIISKTISQMKKLDAGKLRATVGPGICGDCYEVEEEMYRDIVKEFPESDGGYRRIDIRKGSTQQLVDLGAIVKQIEICTLEEERLFSFRRHSETGRQCGVIAL